jgi:hypothetical protein
MNPSVAWTRIFKKRKKIQKVGEEKKNEKRKWRNN